MKRWSKYASFYFKSGERVDKNTNGHQYTFFVYKNGKPVKGAYVLEANTLKNRYPKAFKKELSEMRAGILLKEMALYPDNFGAQMELYSYQLKQPFVDSSAILAKAHHRINQKLATGPGSLEIIKAVKYGYRLIGEKAKGDSVQKAMIKKYPNSDIAMAHLYQQALKKFRKKDKDEQVRMLKKYVNADYKQSYMNKYYTKEAYRKLFTYYAYKDSTKLMKKMAQKWLKPNPRTMDSPNKAGDFYTAAHVAMNSEHYDWALKWAKKALQLSKKDPAIKRTQITKYGMIPLFYIPENKKQKLRNKRKARILAILGFIYTMKHNHKKAIETLKKARTLPKKAFDLYQHIILIKKVVDRELRKKLAESYIIQNDSNKRQVKRINKEAPSLANATHLDGTPLDTTKLAGKVVVLDFWATWCGPCMHSFPHMQKVYDQFKGNPGVKFIILDSGWADSAEKVRKWAQKHDYTFPVYYDKDSKITKEFGVRGIPTTFVIGKKGRIQFKSVGNNGPSMEQTLALKIKILLGHTNSKIK